MSNEIITIVDTEVESKTTEIATRFSRTKELMKSMNLTPKRVASAIGIGAAAGAVALIISEVIERSESAEFDGLDSNSTSTM